MILIKDFGARYMPPLTLGIDLTKANNFRQVALRSNVGYIAKRWQFDGSYNTTGSLNKMRWTT